MVADVLLSIGTGFVTSLVFYFFNNLRNNKILQLKSEIDNLKPINDDLQRISAFHSSITVMKPLLKYRGMSLKDTAFEVMDCVDSLKSSMEDLDYKVYNELNLRIENPLDDNSYKKYEVSFHEISTDYGYLRWIKYVFESLIHMIDTVDILFKKKNDEMDILQKRIF